MRIAEICGRTHRDDGGPLYIKDALNKFPDVTCDRIYVDDHPRGWEGYDWYLMVDFGQDWFPSKPNPPYPEKTISWLSDTHYSRDAYSYRLAQARKSRVSLMCQQNAAAQFIAEGVENVYWLPHAVDHSVYTPVLKRYDPKEMANLPPAPEVWEHLMTDTIPRYGLGWVGHVGDQGRRVLIGGLLKEIPDFDLDIGGFFQRAADMYRYSTVAVNHSIRGELNMRTFEILATRSFMLTDKQIGMDELGLKDGEHCVMYGGVEEAIDKAKFFLRPENDTLRRKIADAGWRWVLDGKTYYHRALAILEIMRKHE